ncbi:hypothetical protein AB0C76_39890 [Kitasatospora sp. NPDC048722]|uniref:hypothetical protein n=1 Tax=Kitasatospora sp. NPDC048722 TaxID=3155639 RepID=UPI003410E835
MRALSAGVTSGLDGDGAEHDGPGRGLGSVLTEASAVEVVDQYGLLPQQLIAVIGR